MKQFAGIDGCKGGWIIAQVDETGCWQPLRIVADFAAVASEVIDTELALLDMPIGLSEQAKARMVDQLAKKRLGIRGCCVFPAPSRPVAAAAVMSRAAARACQQELGGAGISAQTLAICPKIAEVDAVFCRQPGLQQRIREAHPEILFAECNGGQPLPSKLTAMGRGRRLAILQTLTGSSAIAELVQRARREYKGRCKEDDILDALVCAWSAKLGYSNGLQTLPPEPEYDAKGLRMEIVYPVLAVDPKQPIRRGWYRHYKGKLYEVLDEVRHSETEETMVLYRAAYGEFGLWVRPKAMFYETVLRAGAEVPRFCYLGRERPTELGD